MSLLLAAILDRSPNGRFERFSDDYMNDSVWCEGKNGTTKTHSTGLILALKIPY